MWTDGQEFMKKRHTVFYTLLRPLVIAFLKITFGYKYKKAKNLPEQYVVLSNHTTDFDPIFVGCSFSKMMYFVGSEHIARWKVAYPLLKFAFAPIMRNKGASAASAVIDILRRIKKGANVCMFAEGVRTWDGVTSPILPSTAKLIKSAGCGLVTYKLVGGYFASPMWAGASIRRGHVCGAPVNVYTKEQLAAMTPEEIYAAVNRDLYEDAYARQMAEPKPYRGKRLAERLENLLFVCPECGARETIRSQGDTATCSACGLSFQYDIYGMLHGISAKTVKELSDWQKQMVLADIQSGVEYTAPAGTLAVVSGHAESIMDGGEVVMSGSSLRCGKTEVVMSEINDLAMHGQRTLVFSSNRIYYELRVETGSNALKFFLYYCGCKNKLKEAVG